MFFHFEFLKDEHWAVMVTEVIMYLYKVHEINMYSCTLNRDFKTF